MELIPGIPGLVILQSEIWENISKLDTIVPLFFTFVLPDLKEQTKNNNFK